MAVAAVLGSCSTLSASGGDEPAAANAAPAPAIVLASALADWRPAPLRGPPQFTYTGELTSPPPTAW